MAPWPPGLPTLLNGKVVRFKVKAMTSISQVGERPQSYGFLAVRLDIIPFTMISATFLNVSWLDN